MTEGGKCVPLASMKTASPQLAEARAIARPYPYRDYYSEDQTGRWMVIRCRNQRMASQIAREESSFPPPRKLRRATDEEVADYQRQMGPLKEESYP